MGIVKYTRIVPMITQRSTDVGGPRSVVVVGPAWRSHAVHA